MVNSKWCKWYVNGGIAPVIGPISMVSMVTTHLEKESTCTHGKAMNTLSNLSSSRYVDPENISIYVNVTYSAYTYYN